MLKKILFAIALAGAGCSTDPVFVEGPGSVTVDCDRATDAGLPELDAEVMQPDAVPMAGCGALGGECCADAGVAGHCDDGLECGYDGEKWGCIEIVKCEDDHPGFCPDGKGCFYSVDTEQYLCAACGDAGQLCCEGACNAGASCSSGICTVSP